MALAKMFKTGAFAAITLIGALGITQTGLASGDHDHSEHTGIYKDRADVMKSLGGAAKETGAMFKGETPFDLAKVQANGRMIAEKAAHIPDLFPDGTNAAPSEALPIIWEDPEGFKAASDLLAERAGVLAVSDNPKAAGAAFGDMLKACGGCHKKYRLQKDK